MNVDVTSDHTTVAIQLLKSTHFVHNSWAVLMGSISDLFAQTASSIRLHTNSFE